MGEYLQNKLHRAFSLPKTTLAQLKNGFFCHIHEILSLDTDRNFYSATNSDCCLLCCKRQYYRYRLYKNVGILAATVAYNWLAIAVILLLIDKKSDCGSMFCSGRWLTKSWKNSRKFYSKLSTKSDWMIFCTVLLIEACVLALDIHLFKKFCYPLLSPDDVPKALNAASKFAKSQ